MQQLPHVTVATIVERDGKFLMVQEKSDGQLVYNQPAGHVEPSESLFDAAFRETLEETAWRTKLEKFLGVYQYTSPANGVTYIRHCFIASPIDPQTDQPLDADIVQALWMSLDQLESCAPEELRSPLVLEVIRDYLQGKAFPLDVIVSPWPSTGQ